MCTVTGDQIRRFVQSYNVRTTHFLLLMMLCVWRQHWGSSVGMVWTPRWDSGVWHAATNNSDDIHGGGRDLFGHPVE
jgi:hypothetical protein